MFTCAARSEWVVQPSEQQMDQTELVELRLDFYMGRSFSLQGNDRPDNAAIFFFIFNELKNILNRYNVPTKRISQQCLDIININTPPQKTHKNCIPSLYYRRA